MAGPNDAYREKPEKPHLIRQPNTEPPQVMSFPNESTDVEVALRGKITIYGTRPLELDRQGQLQNRVGVLFLRPYPAIIFDSPPIHGLLTHSYMEQLSAQLRRPLKKPEEDEILEGRVDLFAQESGVLIRPDTVNPALNLEAIRLLKSMTPPIPDNLIEYCGAADEDMRAAVKRTGDIFRFYPIGAHSDSIKEKNVAKARVIFPSGNVYYHERAGGARYLTPDNLEGMLDDIGDREKFLARVEEVAKTSAVGDDMSRGLYEQQKTGGVRQVDFLVVDEKMRLSVDTGMIYSEFKAVAQEARDKEGWEDEDQKDIRQKFLEVVRLHRMVNNPLFRHDTISNPQWRDNMHLYVSGMTDESELLRIGAEYHGTIHPRRGGYIGFVEGDRINLGPRLVRIDSLDVEDQKFIRDGIRECADDSERRFLVRQPKKFGIIQYGDPMTESCRTFRIKDVPDGMVEVRHWIFDEKATKLNKDLMNLYMVEHPTVEYAYACDTSSVARRDMCPDDALNFGNPTREVHIVVAKDEGKLEVKFLMRRLKWDSMYWHMKRGLPLDRAIALEGEYGEDIKDRIAAFRFLGAKMPPHEVYQMHAGDSQDNKVGFSVRRFVDGNPTNLMSLPNNVSTRFIQAVSRVKGEQACLNMACARQVFDDGDEIFSKYDKEGNPCEITLTEPTTSFRNVDRAMVDDVGIYAPALANDMFKWNRERTTLSMALDWVTGGGSEGVAGRFLHALGSGLKALQKRYAEDREGFDNFIDRRFTGRAEPTIPDWDMRKRWRMGLKRLEETDVDKVVNELREQSSAIFGTYRHLTAGIVDKNQQNELVNMATRTLANNYRSEGDSYYDLLSRTITSDKLIPSLSFEDRLARVNMMRVTAWIKRVGEDPRGVCEYAVGQHRRGDLSHPQIRDEFIKGVNKQFSNLYLPDEMAATLFDLLHDEQKRDGLMASPYLIK